MKYPEVSRVMNLYLLENRLSVRRAAAAFSVGELQVTHGSVQNWKKGLNKPDFSWLISLLSVTGPQDKRHNFAEAMIRAVKPDAVDFSTIASAMQHPCPEVNNG